MNLRPCFSDRVKRRQKNLSNYRTVNALGGELRDYYKDLRLDEFIIKTIVDTAPAITEITVRGRGVQYGKPFDACGAFRLVNFDQQKNPATHGDPGGTWFIMMWNPWQQVSGDPA